MDPLEKNKERHDPSAAGMTIYSSIVRIILALASLALEIVPTGVVMMYGVTDSSGSIEFSSRTYSFFNPIPFGYAIFFPFVIAVLTCVLIVLTLLDIFTKKKSFLWASAFVSSSMLVFSLLNLFVSMTIIGWVLISLFAIYFSIAVTEIRLRKKQDNPTV